MLYCLKPKFYRCVFHRVWKDIKENGWISTSLWLIFTLIVPTVLLALIFTVVRESYLKILTGFYMFFSAALSLKYFVHVVRKAKVQMERETAAERLAADQEASGTCETTEQLEPLQGSRITWSQVFHPPHWAVRHSEESEVDILEMLRQHNARFISQPVIESTAAETSFIEAEEDSSAESNLLPQVTHRSRHPSRSSEEETSSSALFVTETECYSPTSEESD